MVRRGPSYEEKSDGSGRHGWSGRRLPDSGGDYDARPATASRRDRGRDDGRDRDGDRGRDRDGDRGRDRRRDDRIDSNGYVDDEYEDDGDDQYGDEEDSYYEEDHPDLAHLEQRLHDEVDEDFFEDPRKFHTLHRVIDVLGMQLADDLKGKRIDKNPAYRALQEQRAVVEDAIEHLAMIHCADLNGAVVQVGRVARHFDSAVANVQALRKQVAEIQETLGASAVHHPSKNTSPVAEANANADAANAAAATAASAMSLRELWLQKLECEAVVSLLDKLDRIRGAPLQFDRHLESHRIGAAVLVLSTALETMFSDDVAQVQALHKIMEQLMTRKQTAEEVVWQVLLDVLALRTGNGEAYHMAGYLSSRGLRRIGGIGSGAAPGTATDAHTVATGTGSVMSADSKHQSKLAALASAGTSSTSYAMLNVQNPFLVGRMRYALDPDLQYKHVLLTAVGSSMNESADDANVNLNSTITSSQQHEDMGPNGDSLDDDDDDDFYEDYDSDSASSASKPMLERTLSKDRSSAHHRHTVSALSSSVAKQIVLPSQLVDAEFDLEADERRCLEELALIGAGPGNTRGALHPRYNDPVIALRIIVECVARLKRLDDMERVLSDALPGEIRQLVEREQTRTIVRLDREQQREQQAYMISRRRLHNGVDLRHFRLHLRGMISAFGCLLVRVSHLCQILRHRLASDHGAASAYPTPTAALQSVWQATKALMEKELKEFLKACFHESEASSNDLSASASSAKGKRMSSHETGLFSLGILGKDERTPVSNLGSSRTNNTELGTPKFVVDVLFPRSGGGTPQIRHALFFRKAIVKWTSDTERLRSELAAVTEEPTYNAVPPEPSMVYLDNVIQKDLLPVLQEEAVNGTVKVLERTDAFDPVLDRNVYASSNSNEPQDVDMCKACDALYVCTGPLFLALHRLPRGGEMYMPLVAVLEHVILTFISRVKQQVSRLCNDKTALQVLAEIKKANTSSNSSSNSPSFGQVIERRRAFALLMQAYADGDLLEVDAGGRDASGIVPLVPSSADTPRNHGGTSTPAPTSTTELDVSGGLEREEQNLNMELDYVRSHLEFSPAVSGDKKDLGIVVCSDEELMKAACLAHSLLKLASLLESRLKVRTTSNRLGNGGSLTSTRALREAIKTIKANGVKMAKFCRVDLMMQAITRLSKVCKSSTIVARDAVRIPSSVNDLGEYMTAASDNLREAAGNAVTAYTFSNLEQYIPLCLIQTVRVLASGEGIVQRAPLTMNGIEALDRSGSVLYRDLKGATSFDNSFWDIELAAVSFERSASFIAMMEMEMTELESFYQANREDFSEQDFLLMFAMSGPRRTGDVGRYRMLQKQRRTEI